MGSRLLGYALSLPETWLDHPWGEDLAKVRGKVFVFFGMPEGSDYPPGMTILALPLAAVARDLFI
jgi:hypothetical protein